MSNTIGERFFDPANQSRLVAKEDAKIMAQFVRETAGSIVLRCMECALIAGVLGGALFWLSQRT